MERNSVQLKRVWYIFVPEDREMEISRHKDRTFLSNRTKRFVFVPFAFVLFYLVSFVIDPYAKHWQNYFERPLSIFVPEILLVGIFCTLISEVTIVVHQRLNSSLPWNDKPVKRTLVEALYNILATMLIMFINIVLVLYLQSGSLVLLSQEEIGSLFRWVFTSLMISFMLTSINTANYLISNWKSTETKVAYHQLRESELRQASVEAELKALKLQLDPHFIFNNLSILSELILENHKLGYEYSERFAKVFRFLLVNSRKNVVSLEEELRFMDSYIFLIQHRVEEGVDFDIDVSAASRKLYLPPLTLQLLVENAMKHNTANKNVPLSIRIYSGEGNMLVIENTLCPLEGPKAGSTGLGIANIRNRFRLLQGKLPDFYTEDHLFKVVVHLMDYDK
ncbi:sensor histidine kinase [Pedobacter helvus]|uniref:Sensor histidine kinase n=1 Tax=Pedobacter helvus TaxID=2563444 RepID=A0ABW9JJ80_9SPHI|nr:histidine kinase [Pedobacter ureilyticus]